MTRRQIHIVRTGQDVGAVSECPVEIVKVGSVGCARVWSEEGDKGLDHGQTEGDATENGV